MQVQEPWAISSPSRSVTLASAVAVRRPTWIVCPTQASLLPSARTARMKFATPIKHAAAAPGRH